ncbi:amino acid permease [Fervidicoccus fontis]|uniref:Amino acid permease n=1 Tax=Fervidicoccus fontis TaxID=683846 RepID=A0A843ACR0_9CREN|nr:amino acid permease [Fervidicoccus fontis]MBE9390887.1 amino acid permease [Fervidicoccus fontis]
MEEKNKEAQKLELKKVLSFWMIWGIAVGAVVGDGIFTFTGYAVASAGSSVIIAYLIAGITQMALMLSFGELVVWKPSAGGPSIWVKELLGEKWELVSSVSYSIGWIIAGGSTGLATGTYVYWLLDYAGIHLGNITLWVTVFAILFNVIFAIMNILGVDIAAKAQLIMVLFLVAIMVAYAAFATPHINFSYFKENFMPNGFFGFLAAIPIGVYAYMGASTIIFSGEEAKRPIDISRALFWSSLTFIILYSWDLVCAVGTIPYNEVVVFYQALYSTSAERLWGPAGGLIITFGAWLAAATCILMGIMYQPPRNLYDLSRRGYKVPKWWGYLHPKYKTPTYATLFVLVISIILVILGAMAGQTTVYAMLGYSLVWAWAVSWIFTLAAAIQLRKKHKDVIEKLPWKVPLWPLTPAFAVISLGLIFFAMILDMFLSYGALTAFVTILGNLTWTILLIIATKYIIPKNK